MTRKTQVLGADGKFHPATKVDVEESTERWSEMRLTDGTVLRAKIVVVGVARLDDQHDSDLNPIYHVRSQNIISVVEAPDELKAKVQ